MVDSVSTPFYVTNFPPDADVKSLWDVRDKVGKVVDVYVAQKLSKIGKRFAFVHFLKFSRDVSNKGGSTVKGHVITLNYNDQVLRSKVHADVQTSSFANVVKGDVGVKNKKGSVPVCILQGKEIDNSLSMKASIFCLRSLRRLRHIFQSLDRLLMVFFVKEHAIWLDLVGLPCCAWNDVAVKKLATMWGEVCFLEEVGDTPLAVKRVCIKTGKPSLIHDMIKVVAQGVEYGVVVRVISNWEPDIMEEGEIENGDKVDEGQEESFSTDNTPINGARGAGFVDRKGRFFQTTTKRKGNGAVDGGICPPNVAATRVVAENQCKPVVPSQVRVAECELPDGPSHLVADVEGEGISKSPSQPLGFRQDQSSTSHGSSKMLKKKVPVVFDDMEDVLKHLKWVVFLDVVKGVVADFISNPAWSKFVVFKNKLKFIKARIRSWKAESKSVAQLSSSQLLGRLVDIDNCIDDGQSSTDII
ncbi:unnamed protein product [Lactuca virosa]|uniref:RRM domain-containing protein n=1 Tax=Lactuca virosa TaxID=75947 RepID=A0AAU9PH26_9ASTR|nr:unnamed protein product [Lactuca virosa]